MSPMASIWVEKVPIPLSTEPLIGSRVTICASRPFRARGFGLYPGHPEAEGGCAKVGDSTFQRIISEEFLCFSRKTRPSAALLGGI